MKKVFLMAGFIALFFLAVDVFASSGFLVRVDDNTSVRNRVFAINSVVDLNFLIKNDWNSLHDINRIRIEIPADYNVIDVNAIGWFARGLPDWNSVTDLNLYSINSGFDVKPDRNVVIQLRVRVPDRNGFARWDVGIADTNQLDYNANKSIFTLAVRVGADLNNDIGFDIRNEFGFPLNGAIVRVFDCTLPGLFDCAVEYVSDMNNGLFYYQDGVHFNGSGVGFFSYSVMRNGFVDANNLSGNYSASLNGLNEIKIDLNYSVMIDSVADEFGKPFDINGNQLSVSCANCGSSVFFDSNRAFFDLNSELNRVFTVSRNGFIDSNSFAVVDSNNQSRKFLRFSPNSGDGNGLRFSLRLKAQDELGNDFNVDANNVLFDVNGVLRYPDRNFGAFAFFALNEFSDYNVTVKRIGWIDSNANNMDLNHAAQTQRTVGLKFALRVFGARDELNDSGSNIVFAFGSDSNFLWRKNAVSADANIIQGRVFDNNVYLAIYNNGFFDANLTLRQKGFLDRNVFVTVDNKDQNSVDFDPDPTEVFNALVDGNALQFPIFVGSALNELNKLAVLSDFNSVFLWNNSLANVVRKGFRDGNAFVAVSPFGDYNLVLRQNGFVDSNANAIINNKDQNGIVFSNAAKLLYGLKVVNANDELGNSLTVNGTSVRTSCVSCNALPVYSNGNAFFEANASSIFTASMNGFVDRNSSVVSVSNSVQKLLYFDLAQTHSASHEVDENGLLFALKVKVQDEFGNDLNVDGNGFLFDLNGVSRIPDRNTGAFAFFSVVRFDDVNITSKAIGFLDSNVLLVDFNNLSQASIVARMPFSLRIVVKNEFDENLNALLATFDNNSVSTVPARINAASAFFAFNPDYNSVITVHYPGFVDSNSLLLDLNSRSRPDSNVNLPFNLRVRVRNELGDDFNVDANNVLFDVNGIARGSDRNDGAFAFFALVKGTDVNLAVKRIGFVDFNRNLIDVNSVSQARQIVDLNFALKILGLTDELDRNVLLNETNSAFFWRRNDLNADANILAKRFDSNKAYLAIYNRGIFDANLVLRQKGFLDRNVFLRISSLDQNSIDFDESEKFNSRVDGNGLLFPIRVLNARSEIGKSIVLSDFNSDFFLAGLSLLDQNFNSGIGYASSTVGNGILTLRQNGFVDRNVNVIVSFENRFDVNFLDENSLLYRVKATRAGDELGNDLNINSASFFNDRNVSISCVSCQGSASYFDGNAFIDANTDSIFTASAIGFVDRNSSVVSLSNSSQKLLFFDLAQTHSGSNEVDVNGLLFSLRLKVRDELGNDFNVDANNVFFDVNGAQRGSDRNKGAFAFFALNEFSDYNVTVKRIGWIDSNVNNLDLNHYSQTQRTVGLNFALKVLGANSIFDSNAFLTRGDSNFYWNSSDLNIVSVKFDSNKAYLAIYNRGIFDANLVLRQKGFLDRNVFATINNKDQNSVDFDVNELFNGIVDGNGLIPNLKVLGATDQFDNNLLFSLADSNVFWNSLPVLLLVLDNNTLIASVDQFSSQSGVLSLRQKNHIDGNANLVVSFSSQSTVDFDANEHFNAGTDANGLLVNLKLGVFSELNERIDINDVSFRLNGLDANSLRIDSNFAFFALDSNSASVLQARRIGFVDSNALGDLNFFSQNSIPLQMPYSMKFRFSGSAGFLNGVSVQIRDVNQLPVSDVFGKSTFVSPTSGAGNGIVFIPFNQSLDDNQSFTLNYSADGYYSGSTALPKIGFSSQYSTDMTLTAVPTGGGNNSGNTGGSAGGTGGATSESASVNSFSFTANQKQLFERNSPVPFSFSYSAYCPLRFVFSLVSNGRIACSFGSDLGWNVVSSFPLACEGSAGNFVSGSCFVSNNALIGNYDAVVELFGQNNALMTKRIAVDAVRIGFNKPDLELLSFDTNSDLNAGKAISVNAVIRNSGDVDANSFYFRVYRGVVASEFVVFSKKIDSLPVNSTAGVSFSFDAGSEKTIGLIGAVDSDGVIAESSEENNIKNLILNLHDNIACTSLSDERCFFPNLLVSRVLVSNLVCDKGVLNQANFEARLENLGLKKTGSFEIAFAVGSMQNIINRARLKGIDVNAFAGVLFRYSEGIVSAEFSGLQSKTILFAEEKKIIDCGSEIVFFVISDSLDEIAELNESDNIKQVIVSPGTGQVVLNQSVSNCGIVSDCFRQSSESYPSIFSPSVAQHIALEDANASSNKKKSWGCIDPDSDKLCSDQELVIGTNPLNPDSDGDGLSDWDEVKIYGTNPLSIDSDADLIPDAIEVKEGTDPADRKSNSWKIFSEKRLFENGVQIIFIERNGFGRLTDYKLLVVFPDGSAKSFADSNGIVSFNALLAGKYEFVVSKGSLVLNGSFSVASVLEGIEEAIGSADKSSSVFGARKTGFLELGLILAVVFSLISVLFFFVFFKSAKKNYLGAGLKGKKTRLFLPVLFIVLIPLLLLVFSWFFFPFTAGTGFDLNEAVKSDSNALILSLKLGVFSESGERIDVNSVSFELNNAKIAPLKIDSNFAFFAFDSNFKGKLLVHKNGFVDSGVQINSGSLSKSAVFLSMPYSVKLLFSSSSLPQNNVIAQVLDSNKIPVSDALGKKTFIAPTKRASNGIIFIAFDQSLDDNSSFAVHYSKNGFSSNFFVLPKIGFSSQYFSEIKLEPQSGLENIFVNQKPAIDSVSFSSSEKKLFFRNSPAPFSFSYSAYCPLRFVFSLVSNGGIACSFGSGLGWNVVSSVPLVCEGSASNFVSGSCVVSNNALIGDYNAVVDLFGQNNVLLDRVVVGAAVRVGFDKPDLELFSFDTNSDLNNLNTEKKISINAVIRNSGDVDANAFSFGVFKGNADSGFPVFSKKFDSLKAHSTERISFSKSIFDFEKTINLIAIADSDKKISEVSEINNSKSLTLNFSKNAIVNSVSFSENKEQLFKRDSIAPFSFSYSAYCPLRFVFSLVSNGGIACSFGSGLGWNVVSSVPLVCEGSASNFVSGSCVVSNNALIGDYNAVVDLFGQNNVLLDRVVVGAAVRVGFDKPDLNLLLFDVNFDLNAGKAIGFNAVVLNSGDVDANAFSFRVYRNAINQNNLVFSKTIDYLKSDSNLKISFSLNPFDFEKSIGLIAVLDSNANVVEIDENNNSRELALDLPEKTVCYSFNDKKCWFPNLAVSNVLVSSAICQKGVLEQANFLVKAKNDGAIASGSFEIAFAAGSIENIIGRAIVKGIQADSNASVLFKYRAGIVSAEFSGLQRKTILFAEEKKAIDCNDKIVFFVIADSLDEIAESNELDNIEQVIVSSTTGKIVLNQSVSNCGIAPDCFEPKAIQTENECFDPDGDNLCSEKEIIIGTNPLNPDSDKDGLLDGDEIKLYGTNPLSIDSDNDLVSDGKEVFEDKTDPSTRRSNAWNVFFEKRLLINETQSIFIDHNSIGRLKGFKAKVVFPDGSSRTFADSNGIVSFSTIIAGKYDFVVSKDSLMLNGSFSTADVFASMEEVLGSQSTSIFGSRQTSMPDFGLIATILLAFFSVVCFSVLVKPKKNLALVGVNRKKWLLQLFFSILLLLAIPFILFNFFGLLFSFSFSMSILVVSLILNYFGALKQKFLIQQKGFSLLEKEDKSENKKEQSKSAFSGFGEIARKKNYSEGKTVYYFETEKEAQKNGNNFWSSLKDDLLSGTKVSKALAGKIDEIKKSKETEKREPVIPRFEKESQKTSEKPEAKKRSIVESLASLREKLSIVSSQEQFKAKESAKQEKSPKQTLERKLIKIPEQQVSAKHSGKTSMQKTSKQGKSLSNAELVEEIGKQLTNKPGSGFFKNFLQNIRFIASKKEPSLEDVLRKKQRKRGWFGKKWKK